MLALMALDGLPFDSSPWPGLEHNPRITVLRDVVYGGPDAEPAADRRLVLDATQLQHLLDIARQSPTGRVVIHHAGLRVRRVLVNATQVVEVLKVVGTDPQPEPFSLFDVKG